MTLESYINGVKDGSIDPIKTINDYISKAKSANDSIFAFVRFHDDYIQDHINDFIDTPLCGAPIGIKDIILTKGYITSFGSKMGENYISPYSATCFQKLESNGGLMIGKTNMDEFAMGTSTETSYYGKTYNPHGSNRVPGGSSGGSAAAVAADMCIAALGTDTGGSVRQPAAFCGIVGLKPTYGMVSRYGVQSMASSMDQVGVMTKTVKDADILLKAIAGFDKHDSQSDPRADDFLASSFTNIDPKKLKLALPKECLGDGTDPRVKKTLLDIVTKLRGYGVQIDEIDLPILSYTLPMYYTLMPAELSTNLSRFDGIRFGHQDNTMGSGSIQDYYNKIRSQGFGEEAKRRILLGTFVLSSANYEGYYLKAQQARNQLKSDFDKLFDSYDIVITPTVPDIAWKIGEKSDDPIKMYMSDMYAIPANMAGLPAISVPGGMVEDQGEMMPVGIQLMSQRWEENKILALGSLIERLLG